MFPLTRRRSNNLEGSMLVCVSLLGVLLGTRKTLHVRMHAC
jgi:hypothetical protein